MIRVRRQIDGLMVAGQVEIADNLMSRFRGLMGRDHLSEGQGLLLQKCSNIHTLFMNFPIDAVYLNHNSVVVAVETNLKPWRLGGIHWGVKKVLELRCGAACLLKRGDELEYIEDGA